MLAKTTLARLRARTMAATATVHFHQGPQGRPAACHEAACSTPRLAVDGEGRS